MGAMEPPSAAPAPAVQHLHVKEAGEMNTVFPGVLTQVTPLTPGDFSVRMTILRLVDVVLLCGTSSPVAMIATIGPGSLAVQLPLNNAETLLVNGRPFPPHGVAVYGPGSQFVRANTQSNDFAALFMTWDCAQLNLAPAVALLSSQHATEALLSAPPEDWDRLTRLVGAVKELADQAEEVFATEPPRQALRDMLLELACDVFDGAVPGAREHRAHTPQAWRRIVVGAEEFLNSHLDRPIYTDELCRALAVSPATLADAFRATLTVSPHRYLKLRRLNLVRAALLRNDGPPPLVKTVALSHGFWHLGQFARDYREQFGESPSETLARAHGVAAAAVEPEDEPEPQPIARAR
jgi:AraC family ethanolamine operon transcriptional activator